MPKSKTPPALDRDELKEQLEQAWRDYYEAGERMQAAIKQLYPEGSEVRVIDGICTRHYLGPAIICQIDSDGDIWIRTEEGRIHKVFYWHITEPAERE